MTTFALHNADCTFKIKSLDESSLEMEGGHKRRVVEGVLLVGVLINRDDVIKALEPFYPFIRQSMSLASKDNGGAGWEHRSAKKIPAQTLYLGARPRAGKDFKPVFTFAVVQLTGPIVIKGGTDGNARARFAFGVRVTEQQAAAFTTWLGTDMACTIEQSQVTVAELAERAKQGESVPDLNDDGTKKAKKKKGEQLSFTDAQAKAEHAAGIAQVNAAIDNGPVTDDDADVLADLIGLVAGEIVSGCDGVPIEVIKTWTTADRELVTAWCAAIHARASDHDDVEIPLKPAVIEAFGKEWAAAVAAPEKKEEEEKAKPALALVPTDGFAADVAQVTREADEAAAAEEDDDDDDEEEEEDGDAEAG